MPKLFISYSRVDTPFVEDFIPRLAEKHEVWFDQGLVGGQEWWQEILTQIRQADIFIYLLSNESVISPYCQAEYEEAKRLQKPFLPVLIRARTDVPADIKRIQMVDFSSGYRNTDSWNKLDEAITHLAAKAKTKRKPRDPKATPLPDANRILFVEAIQKASPNSSTKLFAQATDKVYIGVFGRNAAQIRQELNLKKTESPRQYYGDYAAMYIGIAEKLAGEKLLERQPTTNEAILEVIAMVAAQIGEQVKATSHLLGYDLVTSKPL